LWNDISTKVQSTAWMSVRADIINGCVIMKSE